MRQFKRAASLVLALALLLAMTMMIPVSADGERGSITINKAIPGETYNIYLIFSLESYNGSADAYAYKISTDSPWYSFVTGSGQGAAYMTVNAQGYVTWNEGKDTDEDKANFAKEALIYAQAYENRDGIPATRTGTAGAASAADGTTTVGFSDLDLGYYLVDSSLGVLCSLGTTTDKDVKINEKNAVPDIKKKVQSGNDYGGSSTASIGDMVRFQTTITAKKGAQNYVVHDTMSEGLTFKDIESVKWVKAAGSSESEFNYKLLRAGATDADKMVDTTCTFEVKFNQTDLDKLNTGDQIIITYTATLNENAVTVDDGNTNKTNLSYGDNAHVKDGGTTTTSTYSFDLVKTKSDNTLLTGAKFKLYDAETGGNEVKVVKVDAKTYRVDLAAETGVEIDAGHVTIQGLKTGTYWLEEIQQPTGYNKLEGRTEVKIEGVNLSATIENDKWQSGGVQVINNTGTALPTTGGVGTTIFYVLGGALVIGAVVLLIVKKRMGQIEK